FVCLLFIGAGFAPALVVIRTALFGMLLFVCSLYIHEITHIIIIRSQCAEPMILQAGLRFGLIHRTLLPRTEIASSLAGPGLGGLCCIGVSSLVFASHLELLALCGLVIASFHILGLLPWYGDGASLQKALQKRRNP
ncbi:MAG: hypothetical protein AAB834_06635, partial [Patescibacteria group bacterium]